MATDLGYAYVSIIPSTGGMAAAIDSAVKGTKASVAVRADTSAAESGLSRVKDIVAGIAGVQIGTAIARGLKDIVSGAINAASEGEQFRITLTNMTGSAEEANSVLQDMSQFALSSPFDLDSVLTGTRRLMAYGYSAEEAEQSLRSIGDAAAGLGTGEEGIERITTALGQMHQKGTVQAEEMRQLAEAGIPAWQYLADTLGVDVSQAMKMVQDRSVDAETGIEAITNGMENGTEHARGYAGQMEAQSKTLTGVLSNLKDAFQITMMQLGETQGYKDFVGALQDILNNMQPLLQSVFPVFSAGLEGAAAAVKGLGAVIQSVGGIFSAFGDALNNIANNTLISGSGGAFTTVAGTIEQLGGSFVALGSALGDTVNIFEQMIEDFGKSTGAAQLAKGAVDLFKGVIDGAKTAVQGINEYLEDLGKWLDELGGKTAFNDIMSKLGDIMSTLGDNIKTVVKQIKKWSENSEQAHQIAFILTGVLKVLQGVITGVSGALRVLTNLFTSGNGAIGHIIGAIVKLIELYMIYKGILLAVKAAQLIVKVAGDILAVAELAWGAIVDILTGKITLLQLATTLLNNTLFSNPLVLVTALVIMLAFALVYWFTQTEEGRKQWEQFTNTLQTGIQNVQKFFTQAGNVIQTVWGGVVGFFSGIPGAISGFFSSIPGAISGFFSSAGSTVQGIWSGIVGWFGGIPGAIAGFFQSIPGAISGFFSSAGSAIQGIWNNIVGWFGGIPGRILGALGNVGNLLYNAGASIMEGFFNGLKSIWGKITGWVSGIGGWIAEHKGPISYDAKLLIPNGIAVISSFAEGMQSAFYKVENVVADVTMLVPDTIKATNASYTNEQDLFESPQTILIDDNNDNKASNGNTININANVSSIADPYVSSTIVARTAAGILRGA